MKSIGSDLAADISETLARAVKPHGFIGIVFFAEDADGLQAIQAGCGFSLLSNIGAYEDDLIMILEDVIHRLKHDTPSLRTAHTPKKTN